MSITRPIASPDSGALYGSPLPYTRALVDDVAALLAAAASVVTPQVLAPAGSPGVTQPFAGAEVTRKAAGRRILPRTITITTTAGVGAFKIGAGNPLVVTGTVGGVTTVENILLTIVNGGEIVRGLVLFDDPTLVSIAVPAQNNALGTLGVGIGDIGAPFGGVIRGIKAMAAGNVVVKGQDGKFDTVVLPVQGSPEWVQCVSVCAVGGGDTTTALPITVYP